jgi:hypothetical protein
LFQEELQLKVLEKGTLHNWYGTLREAMMRAKEDKPQVDTPQNWYGTPREAMIRAKEDKPQVDTNNWCRTLREVMMRAKEDKPQVDTYQLAWDPEGGHDESKEG